MTTLGDLKSYAQDMAGDATDRKAGRVLLRAINDAMRQIRTAHDWKRFQKLDHVPMDQEVAGTDVSIATGTQLLTFGSGETARQEYVDEEWDLAIESDPRLLLRVREIGSPPTTALLRQDMEWISATIANSGYSWRRSVYNTLNTPLRINRIEIHDTRRVLRYVRPAVFDNIRQERAETASDPDDWTFREGRFEVWPPLGTGPRRTMLVSYESQVQTFYPASDDATEVDWPTEWEDLIHRAIDVEIASQFPRSTHLDAFQSMRRYRARLLAYKAKDSDREQSITSMSLGPVRRRTEQQVMRDSPIVGRLPPGTP